MASVEQKDDIRLLYYALQLYCEANGSLPASPLGQEYALYMLKPYVKMVPLQPTSSDDTQGSPSVSIFDVSHTLLGNGPAAWDDAAGRVVGEDFDYINEPRSVGGNGPGYVVYAEKAGSSKLGRWVVMSSGATFWVSGAQGEGTHLVGLPWSEIADAAAPERSRAAKDELRSVTSERRLQFGAIWVYLTSFDSQNGRLPYSDNGPDYALYQLRAPFPHAWPLDAAYTSLENGVACWDDEGKVLRNGDFVYLNRPLNLGDAAAKPVVVIADKPGAWTETCRWVLLSDGRAARVWDWMPNYADPLGHTRAELGIGEDGVPLPVESAGRN